MWYEQLGSSLVSFFLGGGLVLLLINWWVNHKLSTAERKRMARVEDDAKEIALVKEYRRCIGRVLFYSVCLSDALTAIVRRYHPDETPEEDFMHTQLDKAHKEFEAADAALKAHDNTLLAKYKSEGKK